MKKLVAIALTVCSPAFAATAPELEGNAWTNYCKEDTASPGTDISGAYKEWSLQVEGDQFIDIRSSYADQNCSSDVRLTLKTIYQIVAVTVQDTKKVLTLNSSEMRITAGFDNVAMHLNATQACGHSDWQAGTERSCANPIEGFMAAYSIEKFGEGEILSVSFGVNGAVPPDATLNYFWRL